MTSRQRADPVRVKRKGRFRSRIFDPELLLVPGIQSGEAIGATGIVYG